MGSDIFIKTGNTDASWTTGKAKNIFIKTTSSLWSAAKGVWMYLGAGWTKVWPLSGIFAETDPYITTSSTNTVHLGSSNVVQIGTTYYGKNGTWNGNGWTIQSYSYEWIAYNSSNTADNSGYSISTGTYNSPVALDLTGTTTATNSDKKYLSFKITANASNSAYSGSAESGHTDGRIYIIRKVPLISTNPSFNAGPYYVGNTISYSSGWNTTEPYKIEGSRTIIKWYYSSNSNGSNRTEITRASGLYSWTIQSTDNLAGQYIVAEETVFNSGSDYLYGIDGFSNGANQLTIVTSSTVVADIQPGSFSISSSTKAYPAGAYSTRTVTAAWGASTDAAKYEYQIEKSSDGSTWSYASTGNGAQNIIYSVYNTTGTSVSLTLDYAKYYRVSVRAKSLSGSLTTDASNNQYSTTGTNPGDPTSLSATYTDTTASITFTNGTSGSNTYNGVQYKIGSGGTWSSATYISPVGITGLVGGTPYTIYLRSINEDGLVSTGSANVSFTTLSQPGNFTYSLSNGTPTPSWPLGAGINITGSTGNVMTVSWNAATNANSYADQVSGVYNSSLYNTGANRSDTWSYSSSGNEYATVYAYNTNTATYAVNVTWGASTNAQSYVVNYTIPGLGIYGALSAPITGTSWSYTTNQSVTITSVVAYSNSNGTGAFRTGTLSGNSSLTASSTSISASAGPFYLTYTAPAVAPSNTVAPSVSPGSGTLGSTSFSSTTGSWSGNPTPTYSYQWQYLTSGGWNSYGGATSSSWIPPTSLASVSGFLYTIKCVVTATNSAGNASASSNSVSVSAPASPPSTPTGFSISSSGLATWNAVSGATGYYLNIWYASSAAGANAYSAGVYTVSGGSTISYQLPYGTNPSTGVYCGWADGQIAAYNSAGTSSYSAWYPSSTTYV